MTHFRLNVSAITINVNGVNSIKNIFILAHKIKPKCTILLEKHLSQDDFKTLKLKGWTGVYQDNWQGS